VEELCGVVLDDVEVDFRFVTGGVDEAASIE
jgi:hypothetical protein